MKDETIRTRRISERGYNLVEVLIAMALLGTVMISILGLFVAGRSQVYSGKQMTVALSLATRVTEDISTLDVMSIYHAFLIDPTATPVGDVTVEAGVGLPANGPYPDSLLRRTGDLTQERNATTTPAGPGFLARWYKELSNAETYAGADTQQEKLANGEIFLVLTPQEPADFEHNSILRVRVIVRWDEGQRRREAVLDTVKTRRLSAPVAP